MEAAKALRVGPASMPALLAATVVTPGRPARDPPATHRAFADIPYTFELLAALGGRHVIGRWQVAEPCIRAQTVDHPTVATSARSPRARRRPRLASPDGGAGEVVPVLRGRAARWALQKLGMPHDPAVPSMPALPPLLSGYDPIEPIAASFAAARPFPEPARARRGRPSGAPARRAPAQRLRHGVAGGQAEARRPEPVERALETATSSSPSPAPRLAVRSRSRAGGSKAFSRRSTRPFAAPAPRPAGGDLPGPTQLTPAIGRFRVMSAGAPRRAPELGRGLLARAERGCLPGARGGLRCRSTSPPSRRASANRSPSRRISEAGVRTARDAVRRLAEQSDGRAGHLRLPRLPLPRKCPERPRRHTRCAAAARRRSPLGSSPPCGRRALPRRSAGPDRGRAGARAPAPPRRRARGAQHGRRVPRALREATPGMFDDASGGCRTSTACSPSATKPARRRGPGAADRRRRGAGRAMTSTGTASSSRPIRPSTRG